MGVWKFFHNGSDCFFFRIHFYLIVVGRDKKFFYCFCKSLSFFSKSFPVKASLHHPGCYIGNAFYVGICFRICCICSKNLTEAGFLRLVTSHGNDSSMISSCCVKGINRICKENLIQNCNTFYIAGLHAKYNERTTSQLFRLYGQLLSITNTGVKCFALWEKGIFAGFYGFQGLKVCLFSLTPKAEVGLSCLFDWKDQILAFCDFPE